jgi:hypothetical protein
MRMSLPVAQVPQESVDQFHKAVEGYGLGVAVLIVVVVALTLFFVYAMLWAKSNVVVPLVKSHLDLIDVLKHQIPLHSAKLDDVKTAMQSHGARLDNVKFAVENQTTILKQTIDTQTRVLNANANARST